MSSTDSTRAVARPWAKPEVDGGADLELAGVGDDVAGAGRDRVAALEDLERRQRVEAAEGATERGLAPIERAPEC